LTNELKILQHLILQIKLSLQGAYTCIYKKKEEKQKLLLEAYSKLAYEVSNPKPSLLHTLPNPNPSMWSKSPNPRFPTFSSNGHDDMWCLLEVDVSK